MIREPVKVGVSQLRLGIVANHETLQHNLVRHAQKHAFVCLKQGTISAHHRACSQYKGPQSFSKAPPGCLEHPKTSDI